MVVKLEVDVKANKVLVAVAVVVDVDAGWVVVDTLIKVAVEVVVEVDAD